MNMNEGLNIYISGEENNKNEIVYNNVVKNMKLTKEEQVEYLKIKVAQLELEMKNRMLLAILLLISLFGFGFGLFLMVLNIYWLGIIAVFGTFFAVSIRAYIMYKNTIKMVRTSEYDKVEQLRQMLNLKLK